MDAVVVHTAVEELVRSAGEVAAAETEHAGGMTVDAAGTAEDIVVQGPLRQAGQVAAGPAEVGIGSALAVHVDQ